MDSLCTILTCNNKLIDCKKHKNTNMNYIENLKIQKNYDIYDNFYYQFYFYENNNKLYTYDNYNIFNDYY